MDYTGRIVTGNGVPAGLQRITFSLTWLHAPVNRYHLCTGFLPVLYMRKDQGNNDDQDAQDNSQQPLE
jgi:hypothetical protein